MFKFRKVIALLMLFVVLLLNTSTTLASTQYQINNIIPEGDYATFENDNIYLFVTKTDEYIAT